MPLLKNNYIVSNKVLIVFQTKKSFPLRGINLVLSELTNLFWILDWTNVATVVSLQKFPKKVLQETIENEFA